MNIKGFTVFSVLVTEVINLYYCITNVSFIGLTLLLRRQ